MSEEILKALTQLFAIITKQDGGVTEKERAFVISIFKEDLDQDSIKEYLALYDEFVGYGKEIEVTKKRKLTSVKDSVRTLALCRKINKTLTQKQKIVVLIKLFELVSADRNFSSQRMEIPLFIKLSWLRTKGSRPDRIDMRVASETHFPVSMYIIVTRDGSWNRVTFA